MEKQDKYKGCKFWDLVRGSGFTYRPRWLFISSKGIIEKKILIDEIHKYISYLEGQGFNVKQIFSEYMCYFIIRGMLFHPKDLPLRRENFFKATALYMGYQGGDELYKNFLAISDYFENTHTTNLRHFICYYLGIGASRRAFKKARSAAISKVKIIEVFSKYKKDNKKFIEEFQPILGLVAFKQIYNFCFDFLKSNFSWPKIIDFTDTLPLIAFEKIFPESKIDKRYWQWFDNALLKTQTRHERILNNQGKIKYPIPDRIKKLLTD